jgi:glycosyltransferase involved in cell wall biosynthesis
MVSLLIPTYNEEKHIQNLIANLLEQDFDQTQWEVLFIDGNSSDKTQEIIRKNIEQHSAFKLFTNPDKYVPQALNIGIENSKGEIIVRLDAHSIYPKNYISRLVEQLQLLNADNVGGMWITEPGGTSTEAIAIATATTDKIGIGNVSYRLGSDGVQEVDTVPFGCFRRDIFDRIGKFDTDMLRNQDDEFNGRIIKNGGKIFLIPDLKIRYFARPTFEKMRTMFYQYGLYKPLVMIKLGSPATLRQFAPPAVVLLHLVTLPLMLIPFLGWICLAFVILYYSLILVRSLQLAQKAAYTYAEQSFLNLFVNIACCIPQIHFSYGWGYIKGWWTFVLLKKHKTSSSQLIKESR